jgi:hypothetical protein
MTSCVLHPLQTTTLHQLRKLALHQCQLKKKFVVANDAFIVDSVNRNIEVAKFHINIEVF